MLISVRFLSRPNLSNQMIPNKKIGKMKTWMEQKNMAVNLVQLFSMRKAKKSSTSSVKSEQFLQDLEKFL